MKLAQTTCLALSLALASCASLDVDVNVFGDACLGDLDFLRAKALDRSTHARVLAASSVYDQWTEAIENQARASAGDLTCVDGTKDPRSYCLDAEQAKAFPAELAGAVRRELAEVARLAKEGVKATEAGEQLRPDDSDERRQHYVDALAQFRNSDSSLEALRTTVEEELGEAATDPAGRSLILVVTKAEESLRSGVSLFSDQLASAIVSADGDCWEGKYNEAFSVGIAGNSDFAIKMESDGEYSIKGARLDASKLTRATFGAVKQGISIAAAAYGVPLPAAQQKSESTIADGIPELDAITMAQREAEARSRLSRMAIWGMLDAISQRREDLENPAKKKQTFEALRQVFSIYRAQIEGTPAK
jgi:hypothetical protein